MNTQDILREYPDLGTEDIHQSLKYAAALAQEEIYPLTASGV